MFKQVMRQILKVLKRLDNSFLFSMGHKKQLRVSIMAHSKLENILIIQFQAFPFRHMQFKTKNV